MTIADTGFRTPWEAAQYAADHGSAATAGAALAALGRHAVELGARDAALLGLEKLPALPNWLLPVEGGTETDRTARIDAFAAANGVAAEWHLPTGTYRAAVSFGPVSYIAYTHAEADLERWTGLAERKMAEFRAGLASGRKAGSLHLTPGPDAARTFTAEAVSPCSTEGEVA